jgi:hypothetical protein
MVAIWPEKNGPVLQQCTRGVPPRSYFAQQYFLAHGTCMGLNFSSRPSKRKQTHWKFAEEAVERKEARRVKPWLSELHVPEWQELAGDRLGWRKMLKSIKIRT